MFDKSSISRIRIPNEVGRYKIIRKLGSGGFAVVFLAVDKRSNEKFAIKIVDREAVLKQGMLKYLETELRLSTRFDHPNIVKTYEIIYEQDIILIVMEYLPNGDLHECITKLQKFTFEDELRISRQILDALQYLHSRGICHRDVKPSNILFDAEMNPKLIDFGMSRDNCSSLETLCGTAFFMPPEIITSKHYDGMKADIFSLGVTLHLMSTFTYPFKVSSETQYINDITKNKINVDVKVDGLMGNVIRNCLFFDPNQRHTAQQLIEYIDSSRKHFINFCDCKEECKKIKGFSLPKLNSQSNFKRTINISRNDKILLRNREINNYPITRSRSIDFGKQNIRIKKIYS